MRLRPLRCVVPFPALLLAGCAANIPVNGYQLNADIWRADGAEIRRLASFELKCDEGRLVLTVLSTRLEASARWNAASQVGVEGCGHRTVYSLVYSDESRGTWVRGMGDATPK